MEFNANEANKDILEFFEKENQEFSEEWKKQKKQYEELCIKAVAMINEKYEEGKRCVMVGFDADPFYLGILCDKDSITWEQIKILERLNKKVISKLNYIFRKCDNLSYTYTSLNKCLPELVECDFIEIEKIKKRIIKNSTAGYLSESSLDKELRKMYKLIKCVYSYNQNPLIKLYDYDAVKLEYRKLHYIYRCYKALMEWQEKRLTLYLGNYDLDKVGIITREQFYTIENKLKDFEVQQKKFHTSELVSSVLNANKSGKCDNDLLEKIADTIIGTN